MQKKDSVVFVVSTMSSIFWAISKISGKEARESLHLQVSVLAQLVVHSEWVISGFLLSVPWHNYMKITVVF